MKTGRNDIHHEWHLSTLSLARPDPNQGVFREL